ncbi:hypothetical protein JAO71_09110 [Olleya sp. YSTF-M6]|uniref:Uncharacterized protein n=1 Tax=Olleya sediminilitoris TaxID=2795739 RepID=A0ABS1WLF3_9FLAO|nr:hypothetical protein [Olleya sediminilitoris]MBL7559959.1 hypothetical protein [Olleya sediminilitoris]
MSEEKTTFEFITIEPKEEHSSKYEKIIHHKNSRKNRVKFNKEKYEEKELIWALKKYTGERADDGMNWQYQSSEDKLNEELTAEKIAEIINLGIDFDFDYHPKENDLLVLRYEYISPELKNKRRPFINYYTSFIYNNGKWNVNEGFDHIDSDYLEFKSGIIKYVTQQSTVVKNK